VPGGGGGGGARSLAGPWQATAGCWGVGWWCWVRRAAGSGQRVRTKVREGTAGHRAQGRARLSRGYRGWRRGVDPQRSRCMVELGARMMQLADRSLLFLR
jgi:hypothetical protein